MLKAGGYSIITEPGKRSIEHDTFSCAHCGKVEFVCAGFGEPQVVVIGWKGDVKMQPARRCFTCWEFICPKAECNRECKPKLRTIELEEKAVQKLIL